MKNQSTNQLFVINACLYKYTYFFYFFAATLVVDIETGGGCPPTVWGLSEGVAEVHCAMWPVRRDHPNLEPRPPRRWQHQVGSL